jgi:hypothetical protein
LIVGIVLILIECASTYLHVVNSMQIALILIIAIAWAVINIYIATEVVEEVKGARHMLIVLSIIMAEFIVFFAFQYWFLALAQPASFPSLAHDPISLALNSVMIFVFNPLYLPATSAGRALLLIDTLGALGLVLFLLQNISAFRRKSLDTGTNSNS